MPLYFFKSGLAHKTKCTNLIEQDMNIKLKNDQIMNSTVISIFNHYSSDYLIILAADLTISRHFKDVLLHFDDSVGLLLWFSSGLGKQPPHSDQTVLRTAG